MELVQTGHSRSSWTLVAGVIAVGPTILLALLLLPLTTLLLALRDLLFEEENSEWRWGWRTWWCGCWSCWCGCWWWWISSSSKSDDETHSMLSKSIFLSQTNPPKPIPTFQNLKFMLKNLNFEFFFCKLLLLLLLLFVLVFKGNIERWERWRGRWNGRNRMVGRAGWMDGFSGTKLPSLALSPSLLLSRFCGRRCSFLSLLAFFFFF